MTQLTHRKAPSQIGARTAKAGIAIATIAITAALAFTFGFGLWRFLVSAFLVVTLIACIAVIAVLLPKTFGRGEK